MWRPDAGVVHRHASQDVQFSLERLERLEDRPQREIGLGAGGQPRIEKRAVRCEKENQALGKRRLLSARIEYRDERVEASKTEAGQKCAPVEVPVQTFAPFHSVPPVRYRKESAVTIAQ